MKNAWIKIREDKKYRAELIWSAVALFVTAVMTLPICVAASQSFYKADDFIECVMKASDRNGNIWELFLYSLNCAHYAYFNWMGTYFSKFVQTLLHPLNGAGLTQLRVIMMGNALLFAVAFWMFIYALGKAEKTSPVSRMLLAVFGCIGLFGFKTWQEALYWYSGAMCFSLPLTLYFLAFALLLLSDHPRKWIFVLSGILLFCGSGGSLTAVGMDCWIFLMIIVAEYLQKRLRKSHVILFGITVVGAAINALAPGNFVRHGAIDDSGIHLLRAVIWSVSYVLENAQWLFTETLFAVVLIVVFLLGVYEGRKRQITKGYAVIMTVMNALMPLVTCFPVCLGYSADGGGNRCQFVLVCSLVISSISIAVLTGKMISEKVTDNLAGGMVLAILILLVAMPAQKDGWKMTSLIPLKTLVELADGDIQEYYRDVNRVYDAIGEDKNENVFLHEQLSPADTFWEMDIAEDPSGYMNTSCASYYRKKSVQYVTQPVYHSGDVTYVRIETSGFQEDLSYVSILNTSEAGIETIQSLEPLAGNMVLEIPGDASGKVEIYVFGDAEGKICLEQREIEY